MEYLKASGPRACSMSNARRRQNQRISFSCSLTATHGLASSQPPRFQTRRFSSSNGIRMATARRPPSDMQLMPQAFMAVMGPKYTSLGFVDNGRKWAHLSPEVPSEGFALMIGHLVPMEMMTSDPTQAPNYHHAMMMWVEKVLHGGGARTQVDFLTCAGMGFDRHRGLYPAVGKWTAGSQALSEQFKKLKAGPFGGGRLVRAWR